MVALCIIFILSCTSLLRNSVVGWEVELSLEYETKEHKNTTMECKFDLYGATLGNVQWQKNDELFFKFTRRKVPPKEVFPVAGVSLDAEKSNMTHVFLTNLKPESSGEYSCTVTTSGAAIQATKARENMTTTAAEPIPLLVATRKGFFLITTQNYSAATTWNDGSPILSVGYHYTDRFIFIGGSIGTIMIQKFHESETNSSQLPKFKGLPWLYAEEGQVTSIAVDWLLNTLYFTDDMLDNIEKVNLKSETREKLFDSNQGVNSPESIVVDPYQRYLFWGDNNERDKKIVASALDGKTNKQIIVSSDLRRAILTLDLDRRRLFFISNEGLSSCKYDGSFRRVDFRHPTLDNNVNSLSYYDEFIFWSRYDSGKSSSGLFFARIANPESAVKELPIKSILDVKVFHPDIQRRSLKYSCALLECSDGCATDASGSAYCTCPPGSTLTAGATACTEALIDKNCEHSVTTINSKPACKGELVFEDNFDSSTLNLSKWQNTVRISSDHEMEFTVFDKDRENIYIKNGNLVIKPTLIDDDTVSMGNISLIGCTTPSNHLCEKQAFSYNIIPPVKSALINTAHGFNFRYGVVTIRAKLPRGDWIYPMLNLQAAKDFYSPDYKSGVMRIVDVRGNEQLICDKLESGAKNLMSGVMVGPQPNIKKHFKQRLAEKRWTEDFHTFKFTWTPETLSFSVDDNLSENILPEGKSLSQVLGISIENANNARTNVDPLNQNVYLSVGVGIGGAVEFPDHCITGSTEPKPWRNSEVKSMLKFWQKKPSWSPTWGEHSALLVDYISVRAL